MKFNGCIILIVRLECKYIIFDDYEKWNQFQFRNGENTKEKFLVF